MFLCADRARQYFEVGVLIGRIGLLADFFTKADGGKDTHDPDWLGMVQSARVRLGKFCIDPLTDQELICAGLLGHFCCCHRFPISGSYRMKQAFLYRDPNADVLHDLKLILEFLVAGMDWPSWDWPSWVNEVVIGGTISEGGTSV